MEAVAEGRDVTREVRKLRRRAKRKFTQGRARSAKKLCDRARKLAKAMNRLCK